MFDSGMLHKLQKAKLYAGQPARIHLQDIQVELDGDNNRHIVSFHDGRWSCDCGFFRGHHTCSHVMAMEMALGDVAPHHA